MLFGNAMTWSKLASAHMMAALGEEVALQKSMSVPPPHIHALLSLTLPPYRLVINLLLLPLPPSPHLCLAHLYPALPPALPVFFCPLLLLCHPLPHSLSHSPPFLPNPFLHPAPSFAPPPPHRVLRLVPRLCLLCPPALTRPHPSFIYPLSLLILPLSLLALFPSSLLPPLHLPA